MTQLHLFTLFTLDGWVDGGMDGLCRETVRYLSLIPY